jgi:hypothetical protein
MRSVCAHAMHVVVSARIADEHAWVGGFGFELYFGST